MIKDKHIQLIVNKMKDVEELMDVVMCGGWITQEQCDIMETSWLKIRSIYYPCQFNAKGDKIENLK